MPETYEFPEELHGFKNAFKKVKNFLKGGETDTTASSERDAIPRRKNLNFETMRNKSRLRNQQNERDEKKVTYTDNIWIVKPA